MEVEMGRDQQERFQGFPLLFLLLLSLSFLLERILSSSWMEPWHPNEALGEKQDMVLVPSSTSHPPTSRVIPTDDKFKKRGRNQHSLFSFPRESLMTSRAFFFLLVRIIRILILMIMMCDWEVQVQVLERNKLWNCGPVIRVRIDTALHALGTLNQSAAASWN